MAFANVEIWLFLEIAGFSSDGFMKVPVQVFLENLQGFLLRRRHENSDTRLAIFGHVPVSEEFKV